MAKEKINKTNACRILDQKKVAYELIPYEVDENDLGAQHIADQLGEDIDQVFKTLVLKGDKIGYFVCVIPGNDELDLKKTAKATGNKSCDLIPMKELLPLTGYIRGGCSPVGMKKQFPTFIHETCELFDYIYVSAGVRGLQFKLNPQDLIQVVDMTVADLTIFELGQKLVTPFANPPWPTCRPSSIFATKPAKSCGVTATLINGPRAILAMICFRKTSN